MPLALAFDPSGPSLATPGPWDARSYPDALGMVRLGWTPAGGASRTEVPSVDTVRTIDGADRVRSAPWIPWAG